MLVPDSHSLSAAKGATYFSEEKKKNMIINVSELLVYAYIHTYIAGSLRYGVVIRIMQYISIIA